MRRHTIWHALFIAVCLSFVSPSSRAETLAKLDLGNDPAADVEVADGVFQTRANANPNTPGAQDTNVVFPQLFMPQLADILTNEASFSVSDVMLSGTPTLVHNVIVVQSTMGGVFELFDREGDLLVRGELADGSLSGPLGGASTGSFLTATFGQFTAGTLLPYLQPGSASLTLGLTDVVSSDGRAGLQLDGGALLSFSGRRNGQLGSGIGTGTAQRRLVPRWLLRPAGAQPPAAELVAELVAELARVSAVGGFRQPVAELVAELARVSAVGGLTRPIAELARVSAVGTRQSFGHTPVRAREPGGFRYGPTASARLARSFQPKTPSKK